MNNLIEITSLSKKYNTLKGEIEAIKDFDLNIKKGEIISIVGPSGCGKSTLLSIISQLDKDYSGNLKIKENINLAYMLQSDALLPWLTIYENAILGLKIQNKLTDENIKYVNYLLDFYKLNEFKNNYPKNLSGGMRQRVALIRTLALKPDVLLLDEPFCALDEQTKLIISNDIYKFAKKEKISVILITHNIEEAIIFSDKVIIMSKRPAIKKNEITINLENNESLIERRKDKNFYKYYDLIWKDLDKNE